MEVIFDATVGIDEHSFPKHGEISWYRGYARRSGVDEFLDETGLRELKVFKIFMKKRQPTTRTP